MSCEQLSGLLICQVFLSKLWHCYYFFLEHQSSKVVQFVQRACRCLKTTHGRFMVHKPWSYWRFDIWNLQVSNWFHFSCRACRVWRNHQKLVLVLRHICILSTFPISNSLGVFQKRGEFTLSDVLELTLNDGMPKWSQSKRSAKLSKNSHVVDVLHVFSGSLHVQCFGLAVSVGTMEFQARTSGFWGYWGNADESFGAYDSCIYLTRSLGPLANHQFETTLLWKKVNELGPNMCNMSRLI